MLGSKSNSKRVLVTNNKLATNAETTNSSTSMKRYKSHEAYFVTHKKYMTKQSKDNNATTNTNTNKETGNITTLNTANNETTTNPINIVNISTNKSPNLSSASKSKKKTPTTSAKKKNPSPESEKISSKMSTYISNKPKETKKMPGISKIMIDESIQELDDTDENSKINI
jgi:hypothetical protein